MFMKKWVVKKRTKADIIEQLLLNRGIKLKETEKFFNPDFDKDLHDPFLLPYIRKALSLIKEIKKKKIPTAIWGDYDTDGVTSTALLYEALEKLGISPQVYIPTREEGYGLNIGGIDELHKKGVEVIFVLDAGISNVTEVDYANSLGIKMVILDHHLPDKEIPKAYAVIDTKIPQSKYPFNYLSAGGVVYKFVQALHKIYPKIILTRTRPEAYRNYNRRLVKLVSDYTDDIEIYSIDEVFLDISKVCNLKNPNIKIQMTNQTQISKLNTKHYALSTGYINPFEEAIKIAKEIKQRMKREMGEYLLCSIGIAENKLLAKIASDNILDVLVRGVKPRNEIK